MKQKLKNNGFTLVELLMALLVSSIVLAAVATLAGATTAANEATDQMGRGQSHLRHVSMRLTDLIRRANRAKVYVNALQLYYDSNGDGLEDKSVTIVRGADLNTLTIGSKESYSQCRDVSFACHSGPSDNARLVTVSFDMTENGVTQRHRISAGLRLYDAN